MYNGLPFVGFTLGALWGARVGFVCGLGAVGFRALITSGVGVSLDVGAGTGTGTGVDIGISVGVGVGVGAVTGGGGEGLGVTLGGGDCTASGSIEALHAGGHSVMARPLQFKIHS